MKGSAAPAAMPRRWSRPAPFEVVALAGFLAAWLVLRSRGIGITTSTLSFTVRECLPQLAVAFVIGLLLQVIVRARRREELRSYLGAVRRPAWLFLWVRTVVTALILTYSYIWVKVFLPLVNPRLWDDALWRFDAWMHGGLSPSLFVTGLFAGTPALHWIDRWYALWFYTSLVGFGYFAAMANDRERRRFVMSQVLVWTAGLWLYVALPALGPVYAQPWVWADLVGTMPGAEGVQALLLENYQRVIAARTTGVIRAGFNPGFGTAAMPSLHVAIHWLLTLWCWRRARPVAVVAALLTFLTLLGSVLTGWHSAVDGYVGLVLAQLAFMVAVRVEGRGGNGVRVASVVGPVSDLPSRAASAVTPG